MLVFPAAAAAAVAVKGHNPMRLNFTFHLKPGFIVMSLLYFF